MSSERREIRDYLACATHGGRTAEVVCGECGEPMCEECSSEIRDTGFVSYTEGGMRKLFVSLGLLILVPLLFYVVAPNLLADIRRMILPRKIMPMKAGIVHSAIIIGLAGAMVIYHQAGEGLLDHRLLVREGNDRHFCEECSSEMRLQWIINMAVTGVAALLVLLGLFLFVRSLGGTFVSFGNVRLSALGVAIYMLRDLITPELADRIAG